MPKYFRSNVFFVLTLFFVFLSIFCSGCKSAFNAPPTNSEVIEVSIIIEDDAECTKDCTPVLAIFSEGAAFMSFSGDGENWTDWRPYNSSYEEFNIANGLYGTIFGSGEKDIYIRFKDSEGNIYPTDIISFDSIQYEMQELDFIKIIPQNTTIPAGSNLDFTLHGYDLGGKNEIPLEELKVTWTKSCGVGQLNPTTGLSTTYTASLILGKRNISAHYNNLGTGATIFIVNND